MKIGVTVDCPDLYRLARFRERFLGYQRQPNRPDSPYVTLERPAGNQGLDLVTFQRVPEANVSKARMHLDSFVDHAQPTFDEMVSAGATTVRVTEAGEWTTRVLQDPAGNEFCLIGPD